MRLVGNAYCRPKSFDYRISGQWASTIFKTPLVAIAACFVIDTNEETCQSDIKTLNLVLRNISVSFWYKQ